MFGAIVWPRRNLCPFMRIINGISNFTPSGSPIALTVGFFDGVHIGHRALIEKLNSIAKEISGKSVVITFDSHPFRVVCPDKLPPMIMTLTQRLKLLKECKVDQIIVQPFDKDFSEISAEKFLDEIMLKKVKAKAIVGGYDCRFGKGGKGGLDMLQKYSGQKNYHFYSVPPTKIKETIVSSTEIRKAIRRGDLETAAEYLGSPWKIRAHVISGHGIGRELGYPTANLDVEYFVLPVPGVYSARVFSESRTYRAAMYIGSRPTFKTPDHKLSCEVFLIDFSSDIYDKWIEVQPVKYLREDEKFDSISKLRHQISRDIKQIKNIM